MKLQASQQTSNHLPFQRYFSSIIPCFFLLLLSSVLPCQAVGRMCRPFFPPVRTFNFIAQRVRDSHRSSMLIEFGSSRPRAFREPTSARGKVLTIQQNVVVYTRGGSNQQKRPYLVATSLPRARPLTLGTRRACLLNPTILQTEHYFQYIPDALRKDLRFLWERYLRYAVGGKDDNNSSRNCLMLAILSLICPSQHQPLRLR